ncbi:peptide deformylase [Leeia sp. TBRC 13508]|uniref:Peptide deformylase n=1 Tax=Leeia speluncae TaxID=2884804 RepID=A0ABS8D6W0_9NEIS|nr:peptide deformylase [Leeia speluncae]MCB6183907.1 peptide deformylase [Leeia speluncae]
MALLNILHYPDERLHTVAAPVKEVNDEIRKIIDDMLETMYEANGIGLAATQVNIHQRIVVIDVSEDHSAPMVFINPKLTAKTGERVYEEGCLSVPGIYDKVTRADTVKVEALDKNGKTFHIDADEILSICIQHEIDHLDGKVFVEHLSRLKQDRILKKLKKQQQKNL